MMGSGKRAILTILLMGLEVTIALAGGPRWVAGSSYFDPAVKGKPIVWKHGLINYYADLGDLSATVNQSQANAMVAAAAAVWNGVPTAAISIQAAGSLAEDVNGSNVLLTSTTFTIPGDIDISATDKPLAIVYDYDGSVIDTLLGDDASDPMACNGNGVELFVDSLATDGTVAHALMIVNGRCATPDKTSLLQYLILRAFGRALGLDWSQANEGVFTGTIPWSWDALEGWPLMHPVERICNSNGGSCMPGSVGLRWDDIAALNRLYPVTAANLASFPGKTLTAAATVSIQGTIRFRLGQGMQGVNVIARPLDPDTGQPDMRYPVAAVSGALFAGNAGNPVSGLLDAERNPLNDFGSDDNSFEGWYDLSGIPLPPGATQADYQITFEAVNSIDTAGYAVGPYMTGQVSPSGTMPVLMARGLSAGSSATEDVTIADSDQDPESGGDGSELSPAQVAGNGEWMARLNGYGHTSWFQWHFRAGRTLTIEAQSLDSARQVTGDKARILLGVWHAGDQPGTPPILNTTQPFVGDEVGLTLLRVQTLTDGQLRLGIADERGDGRPDFLYRGRVLYADSVTPERISTDGGPVVIHGMGFRPQNVVTVNGAIAAITSLTSTEITAIAPPAAGATGNVDVAVTDPATLGSTTIQGALSYDAQNDDQIGILTAPQNTVSMGVPLPFTVRVAASDGVTPAGGVKITYTVTNGTAMLGCGQTSCVVTASGDGIATMTVTATAVSTAVVVASLANGASVEAHFKGGQAPQIAPLTGTLYLAQGAVFNWNPQAIVLAAGSPFPGQSVMWSAGAGVSATAATSISDTQGAVTGQLIAGPLPPATTVQVNACLPGGTPGGAGCASFAVASVHPEVADLIPVGGTAQVLSADEPAQPVILRVVDAAGHPMAGAIVNFYETLKEWTPACPDSGRYPAAAVLATKTVQIVSGADGLVSLVPLAKSGIATRLDVLATTGSLAALEFEIEQHP